MGSARHGGRYRRPGGLLYIFQQAALSLYGPEARPVAAPFEGRIQLPWIGYSGYKLAVIAAAAVILLGLWALMTRTLRSGDARHAIRP